MSNANIYGRFRCSKMVEKHCIRVLLKPCKLLKLSN